MLNNVQTSLEGRVALESGAANAAPLRDLQTSAEPPLRRSLSRRGLVFLVRAAHHDLQRIILQWPLQRLRFIPRRAHPDIALLVRRQDNRHGLAMDRLDHNVRRGGQETVLRPRR